MAKKKERNVMPKNIGPGSPDEGGTGDRRADRKRNRKDEAAIMRSIIHFLSGLKRDGACHSRRSNGW
jgi:hypothetical protein